MSLPASISSGTRARPRSPRRAAYITRRASPRNGSAIMLSHVTTPVKEAEQGRGSRADEAPNRHNSLTLCLVIVAEFLDVIDDHHRHGKLALLQLQAEVVDRVEHGDAALVDERSRHPGEFEIVGALKA